MPGVYPPYGGYYPPKPAPRRGQHSSASSVHSSRTGRPRKQGGCTETGFIVEKRNDEAEEVPRVSVKFNCRQTESFSPLSRIPHDALWTIWVLSHALPTLWLPLSTLWGKHVWANSLDILICFDCVSNHLVMLHLPKGIALHT